MKRALLIAIAAVSLVSSSLQAMDGVAISIAQRFAFGCSYGPYIPEVQADQSWYCIGNLVKYTITGNSVASCDTLYNGRLNGLAQYPAFSYDGRKVVFFRWGIKPGNGTQLSGSADSNWISVIDINDNTGSTLRNLVKISQPGLNASLDWPAPATDGNWIYYT